MRPIQRKKVLGCAAVLNILLLFGVAMVEARSPPAAEADILIKNGHVIDGTGGPWMQENVAIKGDTIAYVGRAPVKAKRVIDATGRIVSPGFIDMHSHSEFGLSLDGRGLSKITQGITTEVMGEHVSAGPVVGPAVDDPVIIAPPVKRSWKTLGGFFTFLEKKGIGLNVASYVGMGQVRASVMGYGAGTPSREQINKMKGLVAQAMQEGAMGVSAGMWYVPNSFFDIPQVVELCKTAAGYGGIFAIHIRNATGVDGLREAISVARDTHIPVEIFHLGASAGMDPDGYLAVLRKAREDGVDITGNSYPYETGWSYVRQTLPTWALEGNSADIVARLQNPDARPRILAEMKREHRDFSYTKVASADLALDGKTVTQIATAMKIPPEEAILEILVETRAEAFEMGIPTGNRDAIVTKMLNSPWMDIGSDGISLPAGVHTGIGVPHPRSFGSHTRMLSQYVRVCHVFSWEEAIRKMTSQAADRLGLHDRGILREGMKADVAVFDPATVKDMATYEDPMQYSEGVDWVFVNGTAVVDNRKPTNALPGKVLRGPGYKPGTP
ncbi:MAG TPA: amidohydrolase family protein [Rhizomicrobium sp.]|nr:amidohydrolase family protein [Rhizomicrobium sp.]